MKIRYINEPQNLFAEKRKNISAKTYANFHPRAQASWIERIWGLAFEFLHSTKTKTR